MFIRSAAFGTGGLLLAACAPTPAQPVAPAATAAQEAPAAEAPAAEQPAATEAAAPVTGASPVPELKVLTGVNSGSGFNPWGGSGMSGLRRLMWAPLVGHDENWTLVPTGVAESWAMSEDGLSWTFKIRKDAQFSDGTAITAADVVWNVGYFGTLGQTDIVGKRENWGYIRNQWPRLKGVQDIVSGKYPFTEFDAIPLPGVSAVDDFTVKFDLEAPALDFLPNCAWVTGIVKPADVKAGEGKNYTDEYYWPTEPGVSFSGSWKLASFEPNQGYTMVPNDKFWGKKPQNLSFGTIV